MVDYQSVDLEDIKDMKYNRKNITTRGFIKIRKGMIYLRKKKPLEKPGLVTPIKLIIEKESECEILPDKKHELYGTLKIKDKEFCISVDKIHLITKGKTK